MGTDRRVRAHGDLDPGGDRRRHRGAMETSNALGLLDHLGWQPTTTRLRAIDDIARCHQRRHEVCALLLHHRDALLVEQAPVLDAGDAGDERVADPGRRHGVRHDALAHRGGLRNGDADLVDRELRVLGEVARAEHTPAGAQLDPVRSRLQDLANLAPHRVDPVHDFVGHVDVGGEFDTCAAGHEVVAVPSGLAQQAHRELHPRAGEVACLGGKADTDRRVARVAHSGHPCREGARAIGDSVEQRERRWNHEDAHEVGPRRRQVHMHVHEPGQQGEVVLLYHLRVAGDRQ